MVNGQGSMVNSLSRITQLNSTLYDGFKSDNNHSYYNDNAAYCAISKKDKAPNHCIE